jgi:hypothetical protein
MQGRHLHTRTSHRLCHDLEHESRSQFCLRISRWPLATKKGLVDPAQNSHPEKQNSEAINCEALQAPESKKHTQAQTIASPTTLQGTGRERQ